MNKVPIAGPHTEGRTFGTDWSIANVAKLLRSNAGRGSWHSDGLSAVNQYYLRQVSARHLPTGVSLIFMRLVDRNCWYASLCFTNADGYLPWNAETAEQWLWALFGEDRPRVQVEEAENPSVKGFTLSAG
jgi:hypothetical protein